MTKDTNKQGKRKALHRVKERVRPVTQKFRKPSLRERTEEAFESVPRITNDTVAEHREEVLKGARKYKYPLQHSKYRIVIVSAVLLLFLFAAFLSYTLLNLYKLQSTSTLMYRVTQIIPFPVAKAGDRYVSYEEYLFKLRRFMHYYETQQKVDFNSESGIRQLNMQKPRTLEAAIDSAYIKELAEQNKVRVTSADVQTALDSLRIKNQLGDGEQGLRDIASKFFGWSLSDLKRELRQDILAQKVAQKLDVDALRRAEAAQKELKPGVDFSAVAAKYSEDASTKSNGGQYTDTAITYASQEVPIEVVRKLATMKPNDISPIIVTPKGYEIVKLLSIENGKFKAAHIQVNLKDIKVFVEPLRHTKPPHAYIKTSDV